MKVHTKLVLDTRYDKKGEEKKKEKTYPVKLRVTFESTQKYYPLNKSFTLVQMEKMASRRPAELKDEWLKLQDKEKQARAIIEKLIPFSFEGFAKKWNPFIDRTSFPALLIRI